MINDLQPTDIYVTAPPLVIPPNPMGSTLHDRNQLDLFLIQHGWMAILAWQADRLFSNYVNSPAGFAVNLAGNVGGGTRRSIEMATQMPSPNGRTMGGVATFYGGLGPKPPARAYIVDDIVLR